MEADVVQKMFESSRSPHEDTPHIRHTTVNGPTEHCCEFAELIC